MSQSQPITLYTHKGGPNGWKVEAVLNELGLDFERKFLEFQSGQHKAEDHTSLNPNGRIPTIVDGSTTLWESNAIFCYLTEKYDKERKISAKDDSERALINQWLFFQASGHGVMFGQAAWFTHFHSEKLPSAIERYQNEVNRVLGVLESVLSKQEWLVGGRCTIADIAFYQWNAGLGFVQQKEGFNFEKDYPAVFKWHTKIGELPGVAKAQKDKAAAAA